MFMFLVGFAACYLATVALLFWAGWAQDAYDGHEMTASKLWSDLVSALLWPGAFLFPGRYQ